MRIPVQNWRSVPRSHEPYLSRLYQTDWNRIARLIVHQSLKTEPGERVLIHADPTYFPELTEQVRIEFTKAGAIELGTLTFFSPGLTAVRNRLRRRDDPTLRRQEDELMKALFALADIYVWLPNSWSLSSGQSEAILRTWPGRAVHFHWITHTADPVVFQQLSAQYERALFVDYARLTAQQERLADALRGAEVRITNPHGTDVTFTIRDDAHFDLSNGDASRAYVAAHAQAGSARDREKELPCGLVRTIDVAGATGQMVFGDASYGDRYVGWLRVDLADGRATRITSEHHAAWVGALWEQESGDRDRAAEFLIGCNPELRPIEGIAEIPYWGSGAGVVRLNVGDNLESGGEYRSSFQLGDFLTDATLTANGRTLVDAGALVFD
ncbi:MAG TPA: hypothetical protein VII06_17185 [Chloroflexota bacterium]|jgi:leucyl aminopeptidase (aminopeptidase T)